MHMCASWTYVCIYLMAHVRTLWLMYVLCGSCMYFVAHTYLNSWFFFMNRSFISRDNDCASARAAACCFCMYACMHVCMYVPCFCGSNQCYCACVCMHVCVHVCTCDIRIQVVASPYICTLHAHANPLTFAQANKCPPKLISEH